jgi:hypothetical protein
MVATSDPTLPPLPPVTNPRDVPSSLAGLAPLAGRLQAPEEKNLPLRHAPCAPRPAPRPRPSQASQASQVSQVSRVSNFEFRISGFAGPRIGFTLSGAQ